MVTRKHLGFRQSSHRHTRAVAAAHEQSAPLALTVSTLALQLALGVPLIAGGYSRSAYAATCNYTPSGNIQRYTSIFCATNSDTETQAQLFYSGAKLFSTSGDDEPGLKMYVTNDATISLSGTPQNSIMAPSSIPGQNNISKTGLGAFYAGSRGSTNFPSDGGVYGGQGGDLYIVNTADINAGSYGYGIVVYSAGGRGAAKTSGTNEPAGAGGAGGTVNFHQSSVTATIQAGAKGGPGVYVASIGANAGGSGDYGTGGAGGAVNITIGASDASTTTISTQQVGPVIPYDSSIQMGGGLSGAGIAGISRAGASAFNANGGNGGAVSLSGTGSASVSTGGAQSPGIYLVSEGGIGQNGGSSSSGCDPNCTGGTGGSISVGTVSEYFSASITTQGDYSSGLVAQSVGGAGAIGLQGNGKDASAATGGAASAVTVYVDGGGITTAGTSAHGIVAQSLGAGGGTYSTSASYVGDQSSTSAAGDSVTVKSNIGIAVSGNDSHGILAQSIGGAGGSVYASYSGNMVVGGQSTGVSGNAVTVTNSGAISTGAADANAPSGTTALGPYQAAYGTGGIGILAQSIGGGGANAVSKGILSIGGQGSAGGSGSNGGTVSVNNDNTITTYAYDAHGILAQSIGGGGGNGRNKSGIFVATGGAGGAGGAGGSATVTNQGGRITLYGDYSDALFVQSIGGGGGNGGKATTWGTVLSFSHGGSGGAGGDGGDAYAYAKANGNLASNISTQGLKSSGVVVQSIGGGGGAGGSSKATAVGVLTIAVAMGGSGSEGGAGGQATAKVSGNVTTYGYDAIGVIVQSIGGGGGNGGGSSAKSFGLDVPIPDTDIAVSGAISIATGGSGESGGNGGNAYALNQSSQTLSTRRDTVTSSNGVNPGSSAGNTIAAGTSISGITTFGDGASGMLVQSIGGGGGNAGDSTAVASAGILQQKLQKLGVISNGSEETLNLTIAVAHGGDGAAAGGGGSATAKNQGAIATYGLFADGMIVQSIGGGGGNGGAGNAKTNATGTAVTLSTALGGFGYGGGYGGMAFGANEGSASIHTSGNNSRGILVQSIGGGGGNAGGGAGSSGGTLGVTLALGHAGSSGGGGGPAYAWNQGSVSTQGDWSDGILVQSIGGGGGNAGAGDSSLTIPSAQAFDQAFPVNDQSSSNTTSDSSTAGQNTNPTTLGTLTLALGSQGGYGGDGGNVVVGFAPGQSTGVSNYTANGTISTAGILSHGILAQSIGGGGGNAATSAGSSSATMNLYLGAMGGSGGYGGDIQVYSNDIQTSGFSSHGIVAQSIGGGGGVGVASGVSRTVKTQLGSRKLDLQGQATLGSAGGGSAVTVQAFGEIQTSGSDSFGILAQSIGGGGGLAAAAQGNSQSASGQGAANSIEVSLGAEAGGNMNAGTVGVTLQQNASIQTSGTRSFGIAAQSIGGGGGLFSGSVNSMKAVSLNTPDARDVNASPVRVTLDSGARIATAGDGAIGILTQSIGGSGGFAADATQTFFPVSGTPGGGGNSGRGFGYGVTVNLASGSGITTSGGNAHGILAQSISGGGGIWDNGSGVSVGSLQGNSGTAMVKPINITVGGDLTVTGNGAWGIYAQTQGVTASTTPPIQITIDAGASVAGTGTAGGAILMRSQAGGNQILLNGTLEGNVFNQSSIYNYATTTPTSTLTNTSFNTFITRDYVKGLQVINNGALNIGGTGRIQTTTISHGLTGSGIIRDVDIDQVGGRSDQLDVGGTLAGGAAGPMQMSFNILSMKPGVELEILRAGTFDSAALTLIDPLAYDFRLASPTAPGGWHRLQADSRFAAALGSREANLVAVATHLDQAWGLGTTGNVDSSAPWGAGPAMDNLFTAFGQIKDRSSFDRQVDQLLSNTVLANMTMTVLDTFGLVNDAIGCRTFTETGALQRESQCVWADLKVTKTNQDGQLGARGYDRNAFDLSIGGQLQLSETWFLSGALAYQEADYKTQGRQERLDATAASLSLALTYQLENWSFSAALGGGQGWGDGTRRIDLLGAQPAIAFSSPGTQSLFARARVAYQWTQDNYYLKPSLDVDLIHVQVDAYRERGAGALNLAMDRTSETIVAATPTLELGARMERDGMRIRPYGSLGLTLLSTDELSQRGRLLGTPGTPTFEVVQTVPDVLGRLSLGAQIETDEGFGLSLQYGLAFGDGFDDQSGYLEASYRF
ncbi:hypothetical protein CKO25_03525 [Thiocapsa imhoffii]|uniref:Autotransporter domain-containing protein n=1 Tax=Thiocapsa imhoffii TaxID=382777 RepID=A0A9X1B7Z6_9GAMM|nr:autotransporter outer membrane beta-barrel domain-containing protein [Thiocapsa imhoffii]MBK1643743.1 hypothetical protein [Thiocapsa imhoffii]